MVISIKEEPAETGQGTIRLFANDALMELWQGQRNDTLTNAQRNRIAGAALDKAAQAIFANLDRETSLKWEELTQVADTTWPDATRAVALLVWADLCQPGPKRIRLTETGISILNESASTSVD